MANNSLISNVFDNIGFIINEKTNKEILYFYPLVFNEKNCEYEYKTSYKIFSKPLGTFFAYFLNTNFEKFEEFKDFFLEYTFLLLDNNTKKDIHKHSFSEEDFKLFIKNNYDKNVKKLVKLQNQIDEILDYCIINPKKKKVEYSSLERLFILQSTQENLTILHNTKMETSTIYLVNKESIFNKTENELYSLLSDKQNKIDKITINIPISIESILYFTLCQIVENKLKFKTCNICGRYFLPKNSIVNYCDNIAPNSNRTCRELGRKYAFNKNNTDDPLIERYYKIYYRKSSLAKRNPDIKEYVNGFNSYKEIGKRKLAEYKKGKISKDDFKKWINLKDKLI